MVELLEEQRESWGTRGGFILAAVGSAVGLGNLWGFPYKLYSYGGGAFLIPYIIALLLVGIPIMILEFSLGHYTQRAAPEAFKRAHKRFELVGWWSILITFVIVSYYPVILAYCFSFLWYSIEGIFNSGELPWVGQGVEGVENAKVFFEVTYLGKTEGLALGAIRWNIALPLLITWVSMYLCIFKGVRLVGKIVWLTVPLPWLMLLILTIRGLTLEGSIQGLAYYLDPTWSELAKPVTWRYAFGQVFFSLTLAFGVMITYASFLHRKSDINNNAGIISVADFATSFVAGLAVFATLGGMAFVTQQAGNPVAVEDVANAGPSLAFVAFPYTLAQLPYSAWFSFVFFFALVTLGIDSAFSMTETVLASIVDKTGWRRSIVLPVMTVLGFLMGMIFITEGGFNWLGTIDGFVNGTLGVVFLGLLECIVIGWLWRVDILRRHANSRSDWKIGKWWEYLIRMVIPVVLGTLFFWQVFDDASKKSGFIKTPVGFLCTMDSYIKGDLDSGIISEDLHLKFEENKITLSQDAQVFTEEQGSTWIIRDNSKEYSFRSEDGSINVYFMFNVDTQYQSDLDNATISEELRKDFTDNGYSLSQNVTVSIEEVGNKWSVTDKQKKKYFVRKGDTGLNVYPDGNLILMNCVGLGILLVLPVIAIIVGLIKSKGANEQNRPESLLTVEGQSQGRISLLASIVITVLVVILLTISLPLLMRTLLIWLSFIVGLAIMFFSNHMLDKYNTKTSQVSWLARWAGIIAATGASASAAILLVDYTKKVKYGETSAPIREQLSGVSYVILSVVLLIIIGGLGWSFYKALTVAKTDEQVQLPDEVGDEPQ